MTDRPDLATNLDDLPGSAAPPRANGEFVFEEPWEARAFGMVVAMHQADHFTWDAFRDRLIERIAAASDDGGEAYYESWLGALEDVTIGHGLLTDEEIRRRTDLIAHQDRHED